MTTLTSLNSYISKQLNNMEEVKALKNEQDEQTKIYHKTLKGIETMIDMQRQVKDLMKIAKETNITVIEIERTILKVSINNQTMNATNILEISENLQYLIQSNMEDWIFQIQRMLANELDVYRRQGNQYVDDNIQEIQELYKDEEQKKLKKEGIKEEKVILIRPYKILELTSLITKLSFINDEVDNLMKYMKFI